MKPCATQSTVWSVNQWVSVTLLDSLGNRESPDGLSDEGGATVGVGGESLLWFFISFAPANWVGKGTNTIAMKSKDGKAGTGLVDESSSTKAKSVSFTLEQALWRSVAEGGASRVKSCTSQSTVWSIDQWVSVTLVDSLGNRESPDGLSNEGGATVG